MFIPALSICSPSVLHWISNYSLVRSRFVFLLDLLLWFSDFTIKDLHDFIKIYRALIKHILPVAEANPENLLNRL